MVVSGRIRESLAVRAGLVAAHLPACLLIDNHHLSRLRIGNLLLICRSSFWHDLDRLPLGHFLLMLGVD